MGSKAAILILGLLAMVFLISSEVAARDLAEASSENGELVFSYLDYNTHEQFKSRDGARWPSF